MKRGVGYLVLILFSMILTILNLSVVSSVCGDQGYCEGVDCAKNNCAIVAQFCSGYDYNAPSNFVCNNNKYYRYECYISGCGKGCICVCGGHQLVEDCSASGKTCDAGKGGCYIPPTCAGNPVPAGCQVNGNDLICDLDNNLIQDAMIMNYGIGPSTNSETVLPEVLRVYYVPSATAYSNAVLKINKANLPQNANKAIFSMFFNESYMKESLSSGKTNYPGDANKTILGVYKINSDWNESTVTWNSISSALDSQQITNTTIDWHQAKVAASKNLKEVDTWRCSGYVDASYGTGDYINFTITDLYNLWNSENNFGFYIKDLYGDTLSANNAGCTTGQSGNHFGSSESNMKPKLILEGACGVSAASCPDSQVIMKLSDATNAHGALWDDANYPVKICYDKIFGSEYAGANPHTCTGTNKVVGLSNITNAHAEVPSRTSYSTNVCYGDLSCEMKKDPTPCSAGYNLTLRLYNENNSHISNVSDTNYPIKICCKPGITSIVEGAYWSNMINVKINSADLKDTVKLNIAGSGLSGNVNYTIYKQCSGLGCIPAFFFGDKVVATLNSSYGYATWQAGKKNDGSFETGDYYFKAKLSDIEYNSYDTPVYGVLTVNTPEKNAYPVAVIIKPDAESKWTMNMNINFTQASYDEDDDLIARWNFDDGNITSLYNCQTSKCDTTHSYSGSGTKVIGLTAEEVLRGQKNSAYRRIYVYKQGINVFAVISDPDPTTGEKIYTGIVNFNASLSFVANCTVGVCPIIPSYGINLSVGGVGDGCYKIMNSTATFYCFDLNNSKIGTGTYNLWFNWTFDEGPGLYGDWISKYSQVVGFRRGFVLPKEHEAKLLVGYEKLS